MGYVFHGINPGVKPGTPWPDKRRQAYEARKIARIAQVFATGIPAPDPVLALGKLQIPWAGHIPIGRILGVVYIYALSDPYTNVVRYVGKTLEPRRRFSLHLSKARKAGKLRYSSTWIKSVLLSGAFPKFILLEVTTDTEWPNRERFWIAKYKSLAEVAGVNLTNLTDGGESNTGHRPTLESRQRMSEAQKRKPLPLASVREKISKSKIGHTVSVETRKIISQKLRGKSWSQARREAENRVV